MTRVSILLALILALALTSGCKEETPAPQPPAKPAPAETAKDEAKPADMMQHAKEQAHKAFDAKHQEVKEAHQAVKEQAEHEQAEAMTHAKDQAHKAFDQMHQDAKHAHDSAKLVAQPDAETLALGQKVYEQTCAACHASGVAGAPKLGDKEAWAPHIAGGLDHMVEAAIKGDGAMPPRGGNPQLSDTEVKAAVSYMLSKSH